MLFFLRLRRVTAPSALAPVVIAFVTLIDWRRLVFQDGIIQDSIFLQRFVFIAPLDPRYR
ncbi:hypothetical protein BDY19DRAFT_999061 [Irpex rosettiformis]|uniref:Uncharacterized protein n=1 Tax=Irpex rosettiformis TaxID=378272 RepID=A0ACB8TLQ8_9APHY|nr:hypothetical protein BDY19DRAFT_999061 [Irpex rosettiformis]